MRRAIVGVVAVMWLLTAMAAPLPAAATPVRPFLPVFAYYYQWIDPPYWERAKADYPLIGRYTSDDVDVMRQHLRTARSAGISGFFVSWKGSPTNDRRLRMLVETARAEGMALAINYEALDVDRNPLPVEQVAADLLAFRRDLASDPVFGMFGRPLVIWSGSWKFSREQVAAAVAPVRADMAILASEKDPEGYRRIADLVDGNAYYWSSVDPTRDRGFATKLTAIGDAVHAAGGLWVAPFAPGFDARMIGGSRVVERHDGATLRAEYSAAVASSPDVLGLISWNEFTENTFVEPSIGYGNRYLDVLRELVDLPVAAVGEQAADSSTEPTATSAIGGSLNDVARWALPVGGAAALALAGAALWMRRRRAAGARHRGWPTAAHQAVVLVGVLALLGAAVAAAALVRAAPTTPSAEHPAAPSALAMSPQFQGAQPVRDPARVVVAAAGDIACAPDSGGLSKQEATSPTSCVMRATADLVGQIDPDAVLTLGDHQYPDGSLERFQAGYDRTWGAYKSITHPAVGNHEYGTRGAAGYFDYFGPAAGPRDTGYYSFDLAGWHVIALNSECGRIGGCGAGSDQERWLRADLAAHPSTCSLAYWHRPRYSSGHHGDNSQLTALWSVLQAAGTELALTSHDHDYERFAPMGPNDDVDPVGGIRQFVVGTGGASFYNLHDPGPGHEVGIADRAGVLELVLRPDGYEWQFRVPGGAALDQSSGTCRTATGVAPG
ncbi:MAG: metallophosphoesterase [Actinomycetia bacterium]|nr:metallophosphoesterase [Actinomycetes bacterium]